MTDIEWGQLKQKGGEHIEYPTLRYTDGASRRFITEQCNLLQHSQVVQKEKKEVIRDSGEAEIIYAMFLTVMKKKRLLRY